MTARSAPRPASRPASSADYSFTRSLFYWAGILEALYNREFIDAMRPRRVSVVQWRVLACLAELGPLRVGELAAYIQTDRTALGRLLLRMADEGHLAREPGDDRRVVQMRITPRGRRAFEQMLPVRRGIFARAARGLAERELDTVRQTLVRMIDNLGGVGSVFQFDARGAAVARTRTPGSSAMRRPRASSPSRARSSPQPAGRASSGRSNSLSRSV